MLLESSKADVTARWIAPAPGSRPTESDGIMNQQKSVKGFICIRLSKQDSFTERRSYLVSFKSARQTKAYLGEAHKKTRLVPLNREHEPRIDSIRPRLGEAET